VRWGLGWIEHRFAGPDIVDIVDPQMRVLEQVRGLGVDLERVFLIEQVELESVTVHLLIVLQMTTTV
jgi:hypothetical protein